MFYTFFGLKNALCIKTNNAFNTNILLYRKVISHTTYMYYK